MPFTNVPLPLLFPTKIFLNFLEVTSSHCVYQINVDFLSERKKIMHIPIFIYLFSKTCFGRQLRPSSGSFTVTWKELYWVRVPDDSHNIRPKHPVVNKLIFKFS
jgi:hypothetical protein